MSLIGELLAMTKNAQKPVLESLMWFENVETVKIDPDRDDVGDLAHKLMPALAKMAYVALQEEKDKHDKRHADWDEKEEGESKPEFAFTEKAFLEKLDDLMHAFKEKVDDSRYSDLKFWLDHSKDQFREPLKRLK